MLARFILVSEYFSCISDISASFMISPICSFDMYFLNDKNVEFHMDDNVALVILDVAFFLTPSKKSYGNSTRGLFYVDFAASDFRQGYFEFLPIVGHIGVDEFLEVIRRFGEYVNSSETIDIYEYMYFT